ncbi:MAG: hypothetical protein ACPGQG_01165 [Candidatus Thalassarchaeaceae archaeon]
MKWLHRILGLPDHSEERANQISLSLQGEVTPSQPFHQLDSAMWSERTNRQMPRKSRSVSYFRPNDRFKLDLNELEKSMIQGRTLIIDLHDLLHVDTQRRALRKRIADLANNIGKPAFKIDPEGCLIVVPGTGVRVDQKQHSLGTAVWREERDEASSPI